MGWSIEEYHAITPVQRRFILKEIENETVRDSNLLNEAVELAIANTHRKKGKRRIPLWQRLSAIAPEKPVTEKEMGRIRRAFAEKFGKRKKTR